ncbi:TSSK6-activating co-chaperone protein isoform X5 [Gopherus flavomarginatus]|uniref:TSSK6-activating co-chaperone protein isoform X5 n=1 Tax=Gopherus flavomarginatus TaxID=286002 RepID=UPI0021CBFB89|nr:TSSK6-activating co-chaperone protein isoform X5 [Gopherus flavomarginatus]
MDRDGERGLRLLRSDFGYRGTSSVPHQMEPETDAQEEKQHWKREDNFEGPSSSFKKLCPAKPSPSFLELPSSQRRPSPGLLCAQASRKGQKKFTPDHQPQECYGLLECMHNNIQIQTQIALTQLSILEGLQESMSLLLASDEEKRKEQRDQEGLQSSISSPT